MLAELGKAARGSPKPVNERRWMSRPTLLVGFWLGLSSLLGSLWRATRRLPSYFSLCFGFLLVAEVPQRLLRIARDFSGVFIFCWLLCLSPLWSHLAGSDERSQTPLLSNTVWNRNLGRSWFRRKAGSSDSHGGRYWNTEMSFGSDHTFRSLCHDVLKPL